MFENELIGPVNVLRDNDSRCYHSAVPDFEATQTLLSFMSGSKSKAWKSGSDQWRAIWTITRIGTKNPTARTVWVGRLNHQVPSGSA